MFGNDHRGFFPIAGLEWNLTGGVCNPTGLDDASQKKYAYYTDGTDLRPVPLTVAIATYLARKVPLSDRTNMQTDMNRDDYRKLFQCPGHEGIYQGLTQQGSDGWSAPLEWCSYIFNEALLGRREAGKGLTPQGNMAKVRDAAKTFLFGDGLPRGNVVGGWLTVPEDNQWNWSLYDYYNAHQGDYKNFDMTRHGGRMNVVFCDGHCETIRLPGGLQAVNFTRGLQP